MQTGIMNKFLSSSATQGYSCHTLFIQPYYEGARNLKKAFEKEYKFQHFHKLIMCKFRNPFPMDLRFLKDRIQFLTAGILLCMPLINTVNLLVLRIFNRYEEIPPIEIKNENSTVIETFFPPTDAHNSTDQNDIFPIEEEKLPENPDIFPDDQAIIPQVYVNSILNENEIPTSSSNSANIALKIIEEIEEKYADDPQSSFEDIIDNILDNLNLDIMPYENRPDRDALEDSKKDLKTQIFQLLINPFRILKDIKTKDLSDSETVMGLVLEKIQGFKLQEPDRKIFTRFIFKNYINYKINSISFFPWYLEPERTKPIMDELKKEIDFFTLSKAKRKEWENKIQKKYLNDFYCNYTFTYSLQLSDYKKIEENNLVRIPLMEAVQSKIHLFDRNPDIYEISYFMLEIYLKNLVNYIWKNFFSLFSETGKNLTETLLKKDFPDLFDIDPLQSPQFHALVSRLRSRIDKFTLDTTWIRQCLKGNPNPDINFTQKKEKKLKKLEIELKETSELLERLESLRDLKEEEGEEEEEEEEEYEITIEYI